MKSHGGKTSKQQHQQQQQDQQHQQQRQGQQRSRSEDGLEMRDFPSHPALLSQRSLEEVFRGHEEAMDLNNILAGRPLPSLDLLPPFYHDKRQNSSQGNIASQPPNIIANSANVNNSNIKNSSSNAKAIPPTPSTPRPSPPCLSKTRTAMTPTTKVPTAMTSFMDNLEDVKELRQKPKKALSSIASSSSSHIYEEILYGEGALSLRGSRGKDGEINHLQHLQMQLQHQQQPTSPRYQEFLGVPNSQQQQQFFHHLLNHKRVEKKVAFDLDVNDEKSNAVVPDDAAVATAAKAAAAASRRLDESQRSSSYGQLPKELLLSSSAARSRDAALNGAGVLGVQNDADGSNSRRDPALLLDIQTLEALRELQLQKNGKDASMGSGRYVKAKSASPGVAATSAAASTAPTVSTNISSSPRTVSKKENPHHHRLSVSVNPKRSSPLLPTSSSTSSSRLSPSVENQRRSSTIGTSSSPASSLHNLDQHHLHSDNLPSSLNHLQHPHLPVHLCDNNAAALAAAAATPLHILPGYEVPFNAIQSSPRPLVTASGLPIFHSLDAGAHLFFPTSSSSPSSLFSSSLPSTSSSIPEEPNYRSELAKIERNLLHKNTVSSIIELETALERVKNEVRNQGQLLGPGELPSMTTIGASPRVSRVSRHKRGGRGKSSRKVRSASCEGVLADVAEEEDGGLAAASEASMTTSLTMPSSASNTPRMSKNRKASALDKLSCRATARPAKELISTNKKTIAPTLPSTELTMPKTTKTSTPPSLSGIEFPSPNAAFNFYLQRCYEGRNSRNVYRNKFLNEIIFANNQRM